MSDLRQCTNENWITMAKFILHDDRLAKEEKDLMMKIADKYRDAIVSGAKIPRFVSSDFRDAFTVFNLPLGKLEKALDRLHGYGYLVRIVSLAEGLFWRVSDDFWQDVAMFENTGGNYGNI